MSNVKSFSDIIKEYVPTQETNLLLPAIHTTSDSGLYGFLEDFVIEKKMCPEYREELVYFFYGKASYNIYDDLGNITQTAPVSIVYSLESLNNLKIKRLLPFDSGGYKRYKIEGYKKERFTCFEANSITVKQLVSFFFGSNDNYLDRTVDYENMKNYQGEYWPFEKLINFYKGVENGNNIDYGEQAFSVELQFDTSIEKILPKVIFLPFSFGNDNKMNLIKRLKSENPSLNFEFYGTENNMLSRGRPVEAAIYNQLMQKKIEEYISNILK